MTVKEESEKAVLKLNSHGIHSHHFMANRWGNNGNSDRLYFGGSKITADGDCSHEIKRHLLLGRKDMTNLDSVLKSRDIIFLTKVHLVKAMVFPVAAYGCESWTIKQAAAALVVSDSVTSWTAASQASLSIPNSWSLLKLMSIESVMPSNHLLLCCPLQCFPGSGSFQMSQLFA